MAPQHPVPDGYGSPCEEGKIVTQGTGSGSPIYKYEAVEDPEELEHPHRHARSLDGGGLFEEC